MTKNEIIERLRVASATGNDPMGAQALLCEAAQYIEEHVPEWISVKDKTPAPEEAMRSRKVDAAYVFEAEVFVGVCFCVHSHSRPDPRWYDDSGNEVDVRFWRDRPKPPKIPVPTPDQQWADVCKQLDEIQYDVGVLAECLLSASIGCLDGSQQAELTRISEGQE